MGKNLLPPKNTGRPFKNLRHTFNGILWVMCTGASWRDVPERYGKWNTIYKCFAHWSNLGIFEKIFEKLSSESDFAELSIDSTYKTSKIHIAVDEKGKPRKIIFTAGNVHDCDVACTMLEDFNLQGKTIIADKGYSTFAIKNFIETCSAECCIPPKYNFKTFWDYDREKYKRRNKIERFFGHLKEKRHLATRFDKLASRFLSFVYLASIFSWL